MNILRIVLTLVVLSPLSVQASLIFKGNLNTAQVVSPPGTPLGATGLVSLTLNVAKTELTYSITLSDEVFLSLDPMFEPNTTGVTKIHFHSASPGTTGPHVLNVFGLPGQDDDDLVINYATNTISGIWGDPGDMLGDPTSPGSTKAFSGFVDELLMGGLYVAVHTVNAGGNVEIRGQINQVPEPFTLGLLSVGLLGLFVARKRT